MNQERGISRVVIDLFLKDGLIYESRHYHNVVFKGNDKNGVTRFASMRGVFDKQGKPFKCDVTGNDKNYGFNVVNVNSTELVEMCIRDRIRVMQVMVVRLQTVRKIM